MAKYKLTKPCFINDRLHEAGEVLEFDDEVVKAPKSAEKVQSIVEKAKAAVVAKPTDTTDEDAVLKGGKK